MRGIDTYGLAEQVPPEKMADLENSQGPEPNAGAVLPKRDADNGSDGPASKRVKMDLDENSHDASQSQPADRRKGVAPVKPE